MYHFNTHICSINKPANETVIVQRCVAKETVLEPTKHPHIILSNIN